MNTVRWSLVLVLVGTLLTQVSLCATTEVVLDEKMRVGGDGELRLDQKATIGGVLADGYITGATTVTLGTSGYSSFDVRGWDRFTCFVGVLDDCPEGYLYVVSVLLDGKEKWKKEIAPGEAAQNVAISLAGARGIKLLVVCKKSVYPGYVAWGEPRLLKGAGPVAVRPAETESGRAAPEPDTPTRKVKFTLDPSGLDKLAGNLWGQCQAKPAIKAKIENGNIAAATFKPIGSLLPETPAAVAADLYTAMIKSGFSLVERGQIDKVLKELKIQDTALVDPNTAAKIGKLSGADMMLLGEITDSDSLVVINARLMDTATGRSVAAERVELRKIFSRN